jgi:hypothetical protein
MVPQILARGDWKNSAGTQTEGRLGILHLDRAYYAVVNELAFGAECPGSDVAAAS